ncbi:hypothetical protein ABPG72_010281 [Tetrahymena utriculariae]
MVKGRQYCLHSYDQCGITRGTTFATIWLLVFNKPTSQIFYQPEIIHTTSFTTVALVGGPSVIAVHYKRTKALFIQLYINPNAFLSSQELSEMVPINWLRKLGALEKDFPEKSSSYPR